MQISTFASFWTPISHVSAFDLESVLLFVDTPYTILIPVCYLTILSWSLFYFNLGLVVTISPLLLLLFSFSGIFEICPGIVDY